MSVSRMSIVILIGNRRRWDREAREEGSVLLTL